MIVSYYLWDYLLSYFCYFFAEHVTSQGLPGPWSIRRCTSLRTCGSMTLEAAGESECERKHRKVDYIRNESEFILELFSPKPTMGIHLYLIE